MSCLCICVLLSPISAPPQLLSTFPPLHIPLLTKTRSSYPLSPITLSLPLVLCTSVLLYRYFFHSLCIKITPFAAPQATLSMTNDLRGKCEVSSHQEIKTLASSRCLTPSPPWSPFTPSSRSVSPNPPVPSSFLFSLSALHSPSQQHFLSFACEIIIFRMCLY